MQLQSSRKSVYRVLQVIASLVLAVLFAVPLAAGTHPVAYAQALTLGNEAAFCTYVATTVNSAGDWADLDNGVTNNNPNVSRLSEIREGGMESWLD